VLSACRTARGEVIGAEGVQSLARPFLEKGSRAVVATTWAVEDRHAATLMERFYTALSRGGSVAQSLRDAKLSLRRAGASVSEWSAYTLLGDATLRIAQTSAR
jgi:CHAT domain-containing protein